MKRRRKRIVFRKNRRFSQLVDVPVENRFYMRISDKTCKCVWHDGILHHILNCSAIIHG